MNTFEFNTVKSIVNKVGAIHDLAEICQNLKISRPLLVTDSGIVALGIHEAALDALAQENIPCFLFSGVKADPTFHVVNAACAYAIQEKIDGVIGLGGGSSMDVAKLVSVLALGQQSLDDIYGVDNICSGRLPLIQIPTTAGTGSEVTSVSIVTVNEKEKRGIVSRVMIPDVALLDAELTVGLPSLVTAATGIDAMVHAIEAYTSVHKKNLYSDMLARESLGLMSRNIYAATHDGKNLEARSAMLFGATLAGQAFANAPVAAVHALAYPLGSFYHIPHGLSNSLVLPHVMRFNADVACDLYAELAPCMIQYEKKLAVSDLEITHNLIEYIEHLIGSLGLPTTLESVNVDQNRLSELADASMLQERLLVNNPKNVSVSDALNIYESAYN